MPPRIPLGSSSLATVPRTACSRIPLANSTSCPSNLRSFSHSTIQSYPRTARGNKLRGMSAIRGTGVAPWIKLSVTKEDVKEPRDIEFEHQVSETHGLWGFFNAQKELLTTPYEMAQYGRAWEVEELRRRSFEDIHSLWWICLKERNRLKTENWTRKQRKAGYGTSETNERLEQVEITMSRIKKALTERFYAWEDARQLAAVDPDINTDASTGDLHLDSRVIREIQEGEEQAKQPSEIAAPIAN